jgi:hypothetical protein
MVERVLKVLPQEQVTWIAAYFGWTSAFMVFPFFNRSADVAGLDKTVDYP